MGGFCTLEQLAQWRHKFLHTKNDWTHTHIALSNRLLLISYLKPRQFVCYSDLSYSVHPSLQCPEFYTDTLIFWFKRTGHMLSNFVKIILLPAIITRELEHVMSKCPKKVCRGIWILNWPFENQTALCKIVQKSTNNPTSIDFWISEDWACLVPTILILIWSP